MILMRNPKRPRGWKIFDQNNDERVHEFAKISKSFFSFSVSKDENSKIHFQPTIQFSQPFVHMI